MMIKRILQFCSLFSLLGLFAACGGQELDVPVSSVTISRPSAELVIGETVQITATVIPSDATDKNILWSSANPSVATVSNGGLVTAVAEGSTEITASAGGKKASCKVTVSKKVVEVSSVELNKTELSLAKGASETLIATVNPADATNKTIIWDSRDASVASVDGDGKVTALAGGTTVITAMASGKVASCTVTVSVPVESLSLDQTSVTLGENESITLTATVGPADATDKTVTWSSSNPAIATVEDGKVTAIKEGSATITAKAGEKSATCQVTVKKSAIPVESISLDQTSLSLISGESERLTATVKPDNATDKTVTWSSSNTSVVDVDQRGEVRAYEAGTAVITAKAGDKSATCSVTVTVPVDRITLDRAAVSLKVGESVKLTATIKPADATDKTITWSSSNPAVAKVENGTVTALSEGSAVITAKAGEKSATCSVTVKNPDEPDEPDEPSATGVVETQQATGITSVEATLNAHFYGATGAIAEAGFIYGTSMTVLNMDAYVDPPAGASGNFSATLSGLDPGTTYYYRAFIVEYDAALGQYVDRMGGMRSFTTEAPAVATAGYLNCYEVPDLTGILNGAEVSGQNSKKDDTWFRYYTNTSSRQIAVHTYTLDGKQVRNYTVMYDGSKYAPVWTAHAMHKSMWPDRGVGRNEDWTADLAISLTQQKGLDNAGSVGFSRGHLVASNYRQSSVAQNKQTFYYSNQAPQWQNGFNSGLWSSLEEAVAGNAPTGRDTLYVVSGVLYEGSVQTKPAKNADGTASLSVPIPSHFYKCLMKCSFDSSGNMTAAKGCAYIFENKAQSGSYQQGRTSIDAIENRAGFDFFANVPAALQNAAESSSKSLW